MRKQKRFFVVVGLLGVMTVPFAKAVDTATVHPATETGSAEAQPQEASLEEQVRELRKLVELQSGRIEKLESELNSARETATQQPATQQPASAIVDSKAQATVSVDTLAQKQEAIGKKVDGMENKLKNVGPFSFSGDIRLRHESFFGGGAVTGAAPEDRHRERIRLRFNATAKLNDEISGGFSIATGDLGDPISTNSTETGFFTRKPIALDRAWATYKPGFFKPFSVTAGKFAYTWYRTELTFDSDINVEGASEQFIWDWKNTFLSHLGVVAFQLPLFEVSGGPDSSIIGGQLQTGWKLLPRVKATADVAFYDYRNPNTIAQNQTNGNGFATQGAATGQGGNFGFSAAALTNSFGVIGGSRQFGSGFGILDTIFRFDVDTGVRRFPFYALFNFAQNTRACSNLSAFVNAGVALACNPRDRQAYWAEAQLGQSNEKGDLRFGYTFMRIEREAVVAAFVASDIRQPTNVAQHRIEAAYQAYRNVTLNFTTWLGRQLVTAQSPTPERLLKRLQFDVNYKF